MDALILDFDGVVVDSEPIHLMGFQRVLAAVGVRLTRRDYYDKYLGYDDHDAILVAGTDHGVTFGEAEIARMKRAKTQLVQKAFRESIPPMPGAAELIAAAAEAGVPVAVCSGALREEIELASATVGVRQHLLRIVSAEDVRRGKPDPEGYLLTLERLREATGRPMRPPRCVVIEDSPAGIAAARAAGTRVLAVATSYAADALTGADRVAESLADVTLADLESLTDTPAPS